MAYELFADAVDRQARSDLMELTRPLEDAGRLVTPLFDDWVEAAMLVIRISLRDPAWRSKLRRLLNDILIALCARRIGAVLLTRNRDDFLLIRRHKGLSLRILD